MRAIAFVPARGGSERIAMKNLEAVGGHSLVALAVQRGIRAGLPVVVSTDHDDIADEAMKYGAQVHRRHEFLSGPSVQIERVLAHYLHTTPSADDVERLCILQPTSPFLSHEAVMRCMDQLDHWHAALTVCRETHFRGRLKAHPNGVQFIRNAPIGYRPRTQDMRWMGYETGGCYSFTRHHFRESGNRLSPTSTAAVEVSFRESLDIDTWEDLEMARRLA